MLTQIHGPLVQEARGNMSSIVHLHWQLVVLEFSARCLTVETDRLTALAGIADRLCRVTSQQYYYGILFDNAVRGPLRRHKPNPKRKQASHRLPVGSAPSWSFGSVTGRVGFVPDPERFTLFVSSATIYHISRQLASENPYGSGRGAVDITGVLVNIVVEDEKNSKCGKDGSLSFTVDVMDTEAKRQVRGYFQPDVEIMGQKSIKLLQPTC